MDERDDNSEAGFASSATTLLTLEAKGVLTRAEVLSIFAQASELCRHDGSKALLDRALRGLVQRHVE